MRIVLLNSSTVSKPKDYIQHTWPWLRIGVASIAAYLRSKGHDVFLFDPQAENLEAGEAADKACSFRPDYVGLSAYTHEIHDAAEIARRIKERIPQTVVVVGGYHPSGMPEETLAEFDSFDIAVYGEGELPFEEIAAGRPLAEIQNIAFRDADGPIRLNEPRTEHISLDALPIPAWDLYQLDKYRLFNMQVESVRGCPYGCLFCLKARGAKVRYKTPGRVLDELEQVIARYGLRRIFLGGNGSFPLDRQHALDICNGIIARGLDIEWITGARIDVLDDELLAKMRQSGCYYIDIGTESGDPEILKKCGKGFDPDAAERAVKACHKAGIETELNFVLGLPGETRASLRNTLKFANRLRMHSTLANFAMLTPYPGTTVYEMASRNEGGMRLKTRDWRQYLKFVGDIIEYDHFKPGELAHIQARMCLSYYFGSPFKIFQLLNSKVAKDFDLFDVRRFLQVLRRIF